MFKNWALNSYILETWNALHNINDSYTALKLRFSLDSVTQEMYRLHELLLEWEIQNVRSVIS